MKEIFKTRDRIQQRFSDLVFHKEPHYYTVGGVLYPSVSSLVENHSFPFDEAKWLPIKSLQLGVTEHELKHKWQTINRDACYLGTETHDFMEKYTGIETPQSPQQKAGVLFFHEMSQDYDVIFREIRMYSKIHRIAGTEDLILAHKKTGDIISADYKTNKDLFKGFGFLRPPFGYLEGTPYNKAQLQLSYYQVMLEEAGFKVQDRWLVYLKADGTYKIFKTWDFTEQLKALLRVRLVLREAV